jgi:hypothetical protein
MPQNILGYVVNVLPKDPTVPSTYVADIIAAGATTTIEYPAQYRAVAISVAIRNQDTVNACQFSANGQPLVTLSAGGSENLNDLNIIRVQVVAGAAGAVHVFSQVTPMFFNTEAQRFRTVSQ